MTSPTTRSTSKAQARETTSSLAYELEDNLIQDILEQKSTQRNDSINFYPAAISKLPKISDESHISSENSNLTQPMIIQEALNDPTWKTSIDIEIMAQIDKNTWELVTPPPSVNFVGSKWTFFCKGDQKSSVTCCHDLIILISD